MALAPRISRTVTQVPKRTRAGDDLRYLSWLKTLPCVCCGKPADDPHHLMRVRDGQPRGTGRRNEDRYALPMCRMHHDDMHAPGKGAADDELYLLETYGIRARDLCDALWSVRGSEDRDDKAHRLIARAQQSPHRREE